MTTDDRDPRSPESYATFWEPITLHPQPEPVVSNSKDAYQDFVNVTEDAPVILRVEQI